MSNLNESLLNTPDLNAERLAELKRLFPDLFTIEGRLNADEVQKLVDPQHAGEQERYEFKWFGKSQAKRNAFTPTNTTLVFDDERSLEPDTGRNIIIEGENLEVLKLLLCGYREKVKCIYIDPPYNTGKDFVYSDNYTEEKRPYWEKTGAMRNGVKADTNPDTSGRYHSDWLNMMFSRLLVARALLRPDGAIFISIDDKEVHNLRKLCEEVFGAENFLAEMIWEGAGKNDARQIGVSHEYVLVYGKERAQLPSEWAVAKFAVEPVLKQVNKLKKEFGNDFDAASEALAAWFLNMKASPSFAHRRFRYIDERGAYKEDDPTAPGGRKFELINPRTGGVIPLRANRGWAFSQEDFNKLVAEGRISFVTEESIMVRRYLHETDTLTPQSVLYQPARSASERLSKLLNSIAFEFPKDELVLRQFIEMATDRDSLVLDFFAGSGATGHAVAELNKQDGGNREFILVQLPELTDEKSAAFKAGYMRISDITIERVKRAIARIGANAKGNKVRSGFKVFTLEPSNFPRVEFRPDENKSEEENLAALRYYISAKEQQQRFQFNLLDLTTEILIKQGFNLNFTYSKRAEFNSNDVYLATDGEKRTLLCLDEAIRDETVGQLKTNTDDKFICLERALDTTKKWNLDKFLGERFKAI